MRTEKSIYIPRELESFRNQIESSLVDSIWITPTEGYLSLTDSKFAGYPYLPKSHLYPKDSNDEYMPLLAQINFSDLPINPLFPSKGLLQFFVSNKFSYPIGKKEELLFQQDFKVRYFTTILEKNQLTEDFSHLMMNRGFPIQKEMKLEFHKMSEPVSATDYRREKFLHPEELKDEFHSDVGQTFEGLYLENYLAAEHKLGGYPYFVDCDTRKNSAFLKKFDLLLFQIVSNDEQGIMYGDSGIIKFFINQHALRSLDFSSVYFIAEQF
ncbi:YwqG family protein [Lysinibacillus sp. SGAir0095]|uniref:YwqG family protein n=1 Tax=Lysinibacillus sp. SGAir0095 TaxID=2070463 RepID=UPI00143E0E56|nr:YwqG family protein [Lysinibacillus sp. SGAir0095]